MDAVTYPDTDVVRFINSNVVALRVPFDHAELSKRFQIKWTPTLITLDSEGSEHHRTIGFLNPDNLLANLTLGIAKCHFDRDNFNEALPLLESITENHPKSEAAAEAIYLSGVAKFKTSHEAAPLKEAYEMLVKKFPDNQWTHRAEPYRLL